METPDLHRSVDLLAAAVRGTPAAPEPSPGAGAPSQEAALEALEVLHRLRAQLAVWEPALIESARDAGASWARIAPALGVTSRQAAERRYLRLRPNEDAALTREERVRATRDERAGERAVAAWARENASELRQIAGQVSAVTGLSRTGMRGARTVAGELTGDDPATLLEPLADMHDHLVEDHAALAARVATVGRRVSQVRRDTRNRRGAAPQS